MAVKFVQSDFVSKAEDIAEEVIHSDSCCYLYHYDTECFQYLIFGLIFVFIVEWNCQHRIGLAMCDEVFTSHFDNWYKTVNKIIKIRRK